MKLKHWVSRPVSSIHGTINVPGDKSISHRSIIFGAIAQGTSIVHGFLQGDDCLATINAFKAMGVSIKGPHDNEVVIHGGGKWGLKKPHRVIDCGNSGTTMRLLAGLLAGQKFDSELTGDNSLLKRPMRRISTPLTQMGADVHTQGGLPPLMIRGGKTLTGIDYVMPEASAQVKSCILLAGLYAKGTTRITETGVSRDHTELMLKTFGYPLEKKGHTLEINSAGECLAAKIRIPGDISSAAFFIVAASILPGSNIVIRNVGVNPTRTGVLDILDAMGANITLLNIHYEGEERVADIKVKYAPLKGINIPKSWVSRAIDEFPILFIAAACAKGETTVHGAKELRMKESDRIGVMAEGLNQLGIEAKPFEDGISIHGGKLLGGVVESRGDHRIAMAFAIAGAVALEPITIVDCAPVRTSFPSFITTANTLHFQLEELSDNA